MMKLPIIIIFICLLYALPKSTPTVEVPSTQIPTPTPDIRVQKLESFFKKYNSPMAGESAELIRISDDYGIPYGLFVGIAGAESTFETLGNCYDYNPYGLGCTGKSPCYTFSSFTDATRTLAGTLINHKAYTEFRKTGEIRKLAERYLTGDKDRWTFTVKKFMNEL